MEHRKEPDLGAEMARIGGNGPQRLGDRPEEQAIDDGLVLVRDRRGHREHDMEVVDGKAGPRGDCRSTLPDRVTGTSGGASVIKCW